MFCKSPPQRPHAGWFQGEVSRTSRPMSAEAADVGVILVDYRSDPQLSTALSALADDASGRTLRVIVVQNSPTAAPPASPTGLAVEWIRSEENLGFGRAVNLARARLSTPYLWVLNPDVQPAPSALGILCDYLDAHPNIGIVAPKLLDADGRLQFSVRTFYDLPTLLLRRTPLGRCFPNHPRLRRHLMSDWDHADIREVDWALGACLLIRSAAVPVEVFDPRFFLYFEDVDLCLRLKKAGWPTIYHPQATVRHLHRQASRRNPLSRAGWEHICSGIRFIVKHRGLGCPPSGSIRPESSP